ncbi:gluconokinase, GntK/IdnK-type [Anderseniella sp. Alg231-50]|uniref:gluconokinase, GntK/IdnK-type n=1 Tax=Anderseniella sp. Alg231-50 TaxID=1922226 RepID=UPI000D562DB9
MIVVVMGVCGCGKTTIGRMLAARLDAAFIEGDELHPAGNKEKMAAGVPLNDEDREPWLDAIAVQAAQVSSGVPCVVVSCSALKRVYRDRLRNGGGDLKLVHLTGSRSLLETRMSERRGHFMPAGLLDSQLATLEVPEADEAAVNLDIAEQPDAIVGRALAFLKFSASSNSNKQKETQS